MYFLKKQKVMNKKKSLRTYEKNCRSSCFVKNNIRKSLFNPIN